VVAVPFKENLLGEPFVLSGPESACWWSIGVTSNNRAIESTVALRQPGEGPYVARRSQQPRRPLAHLYV